MSKYKGYIENFPEEVVEWMCDQQVKQGNPRDVRVFEKYKLADNRRGGFTWAKVIPIECRYSPFDFCKKVIEDEEFELFAQCFPKKPQLAPEIDIDAILQTKDTGKPIITFNDEHRFQAACAVMTGILSNPHCSHFEDDQVAAASVAQADALIEALMKGKEQ